MSAWLCTATHVAAIVRWQTEHAPDAPGWGRPEFKQTRPEGTATMLHQENIRSLEGRYPDSFGDFGAPHEFSAADIRRAPRLSPVECIKACHCLAYQSCEHEGWKASAAKHYLDAVESAAVSKLPGYDDAPWGIDDPAGVTL